MEATLNNFQRFAQYNNIRQSDLGILSSHRGLNWSRRKKSLNRKKISLENLFPRKQLVKNYIAMCSLRPVCYSNRTMKLDKWTFSHQNDVLLMKNFPIESLKRVC